jgi:hypothetical protein
MHPAVPRSQAGEKSLSERSDEEEAPELEEADTVTVLETHNDQARPLNVDRLPDADFFKGAFSPHLACPVATRGGAGLGNPTNKSARDVLTPPYLVPTQPLKTCATSQTSPRLHASKLADQSSDGGA